MPTFKDQAEYSHVWRNEGFADSGDFISMTDVLASPDTTKYFKVTMEDAVREAIEPMLPISTSLLAKVKYEPGMTASFGAIGAAVAGDVAESGEYPEIKLQTGTGVQITTIGKSGIAFKWTEEMQRYNQYGIVDLHLKACARALARHKESKALAMFTAMGITTHDNANPGASRYGTTSGRAYSGSGNGSVTMDNIIEAYTALLMEGFTPDTIIVHPLTFSMFLTDPVLRAVAVETGSLNNFYNMWSGNAADVSPWSKGALGAAGPLYNAKGEPLTERNVKEYNGSAAPKLPSYLGLPFKIMVSPYVPYNPQTKLTNVYVLDSSNVGALLVDEEPVVDNIPDLKRDENLIKVRERYAILPFNAGHAIAVMKNVHVVPAEITAPTMATATLTNSLNRASAIS